MKQTHLTAAGNCFSSVSLKLYVNLLEYRKKGMVKRPSLFILLWYAGLSSFTLRERFLFS